MGVKTITKLDKIRQYLQDTGRAPHVIDGGLGGLVRRWEKIVERIAAGRPGSEMYYEFLNDADCRNILAEIWPLVSIEERFDYKDRVEAADNVFRNFTLKTDRCITKSDKARGIVYSPYTHWPGGDHDIVP